MTTIDARVYLHCPRPKVLAYLSEGLSVAAPGTPRRLELRSHIPSTPIEFAKCVLIECELQDGPSWIVRWTPEPGGIYPVFDGRLSVGEDLEDRRTVLHLHGTYQPPLGTAGAAFDKALGHRLSYETATEFLMDLAAEMRARYAYEQAISAYGSNTSPA
jgi:hypothetical protein